MSKRKKLPPEVVNSWPDIFEDIEISVVPVEYLDSVHVQFHDGKIWEIDIKKSLNKTDIDIENALEDLFEQYEDAIKNVDFRLNTEKVKKDIKKRTKIFMKKRK